MKRKQTTGGRETREGGKVSGFISFFVPGIPRPGGSKTPTVVRRRGGEIVYANGRPLVTTRDACKGNADWKRTVSFYAREQYEGEPLRGALFVSFVFTMPRPKSHYGTGRNADKLKDSAPVYHTSKPDALKLARSTEDALTKIAWADDAQTAKLEIIKLYGEKPGVCINITTIKGKLA